MQLLYILLSLISYSVGAVELPKTPEPIAKEEFLIQPPPAPSNDMPTLGRQMLFHNGNRVIERLKKNDPSLGRTITKIESTANVAPPPIEADNFKLTTGMQLDKGVAYSEVFWYSPKLRSEVNVIKKNTTFKLIEGPVSTTYSRAFNNSFNLMLVLSKTFE